MQHSRIEYSGLNPVLCIGEERHPACAYITYFEERNDYKAFYDRGFRIFSVSVSLAMQPINANSGFTPFRGGIFDQKGKADYSHFDRTVTMLLQDCPDALIFPRVYCCMPQWWIDENDTETIPVAYGKRREALYSQKYRETASEMLSCLLDHIEESDFRDHIFGYQLSGGQTEEWFHCDLSGGYCENALPYFNDYLLSVGKNTVKSLPDLAELHNDFIEDPVLRDYLAFCNVSVAQTIGFLCRKVKEKLRFSQIVGVFYGYLAEVSTPLWGTHALGELLDSPYIDFFSSPMSYHKARAFGMDWADMIPVSSVRLHKKAVFTETDVRTCLTKSPGESRPGSDPHQCYTAAVWKGPETKELSATALRKAFAKQLTSAHGMWWFDMFGGWYKDETLYNEAALAHSLYTKRIANPVPDIACEIAVFGDATMFYKIGNSHKFYGALFDIRFDLARLGAPFHFYLLSDFENIRFEDTDYKAVVFCAPIENECLANAKRKLTEKGISYVSLDECESKPDWQLLSAFITANGVHRYCESGDVFYIGNGFAALHAASEGEKQIVLPEKMHITDSIRKTETVTDRIVFDAKQYETRIFELL